jgi:glycosyltransferase involved in cell wall biosynthesis
MSQHQDPKPAPRSVGARETEGVFARLGDRLAPLTPSELKAKVRRARAEARAALVSAAPLPLYELWKLKSFDPFVSRATTLSYGSSGTHFLILADSPITDCGGGRRAGQIALELLERSHRVTYVYRFPSREKGRHRRSLAHENLTHQRFSELSVRRFALERASRERIVVLCEVPLAEHRAAMRYLHKLGARTLYDCCEDWEALGPAWYARGIEEQLLREADVVTSSARALKDSLEIRCSREVHLLPNAVNARLFSRQQQWPRPPDLPRAEGIFTYVGALWGEGFDWGLVGALARARPASKVVLIGDWHGPRPAVPPNLCLLGSRPQAEIPAYLAHSDACLLPIRPSRLAGAACPLKLYEYLAMGKPVIATDLPELRELPGVRIARDASGLAEQARLALEQGGPSARQTASFAAENGWKARVRQLERLLGV